MPGPRWLAMSVLCAAAVGSPGVEPKLGKLIMLPPWTEIPGVMGTPGRLPVPAPPGPGTLEVPILAVVLAPGPDPTFPLPGPAPALALPESGPVELPVPPPEPPMPGVLPPEGDMARAPRSPLVGAPSAGPGLLEIMAAALWAVPPALAGGATIVP